MRQMEHTELPCGCERPFTSCTFCRNESEQNVYNQEKREELLAEIDNNDFDGDDSE